MTHIVQKPILADVCVVCGCRLTAENRSEVVNVCFECLHVLES
jgi:hypothetical protein